jgi:hypothetical protein
VVNGCCCGTGAGVTGVVEAGNAGVSVVAFFFCPELEQAARTKARNAAPNSCFVMYRKLSEISSQGTSIRQELKAKRAKTY